jgi:hypothetical protein
MAFLGNLPSEVYKSLAKQTITGTGATSYSLDHNVGSAVDLEVFVNNVRQEPDVAYTASGASITFTTALEASDECYVIYQGKAISSNSIQSQNIADGSITADKTNFIDSNGFYVPTLAADPSNPIAGQMYYNTTDGVVRHYDGSKWLQMSNKFMATGGTITDDGTYQYHTFTTSGTFTILSGSSMLEYLVVAGGGGGGSSSVNSSCGGGGAGGMLYGSIFATAGESTIVVGAGATTVLNTNGGNGANSSISGFVNITSIGGGGGGGGSSSTSTAKGGDGGSGGGTLQNNQGYVGGLGTSGQGNNGGLGSPSSPSWGGAGGGGKSTAGTNGTSTNAGPGGDGAAWVNGSYYAGGGGGATYNGYTGGAGGIGGGGAGGSTSAATPGTANTGGGGGASSYPGNTYGAGGNGGSGIVIIRYAI